MNSLMKLATTALFATGLTLGATAQTQAGSAQDAIIAALAAQAGGATFSAAKGKAFFETTHTGGKPATPSCSTCHTKNPRAMGKTRVGKLIQPMALSITPDRFSDPAKVAKWFRRNCKSVLGRECSPTEKGNFLTYLTSL